jgi:hypothetical protein
MKTFARRLTLLAVLSAAALAALGCGEDGQDVDGSRCPSIPLFRYVQQGQDSAGNPIWVKVHPDGSPFTDAELAEINNAIAQNEKTSTVDPKGRCMTPPGAATSVPGSAAGGGSGSGGSGTGGSQ